MQQLFQRILLILVLAVAGTTAFAPLSPRIASSQLERTSLASSSDPNEKLPSSFGSSDPVVPPAKQEPSPPPLWLTQLANVVIDGTSAVFSTLCLGISMGLVLNIFGYGYTFHDGDFRLDTLPQLRQDAQFRREINRSMREAAIAQQAASRVASSNMAMTSGEMATSVFVSEEF
uniref:Uncharacterized protein n=1 Tax=Entomoneis paludosa TaxID=265537 RepID=A0A7S3DUF6_9STRA|mmetsp:Transcript_36289/g.75499  ORF Transcript_36289/g.75499 Transcript_36289/m.75499 type:complete len:174 (+) Transcript_36289:113-634(+)|eukprot:CAMPEP_0172460034 /NCGR_PEP_ID=MMETSP1065-20121228/35205_1 /TAXON_ID=265537 /ORGANISM="Amphiprora paludosa, Strain CCMP125" /LENGTH=173 /DNA_ID=CAMNT_0013214927 /DNA_START=44 /DNA_END=565 /DNA_ORIENTATION=-